MINKTPSLEVLQERYSLSEIGQTASQTPNEKILVIQLDESDESEQTTHTDNLLVDTDQQQQPQEPEPEQVEKQQQQQQQQLLTAVSMIENSPESDIEQSDVTESLLSEVEDASSNLTAKRHCYTKSGYLSQKALKSAQSSSSSSKTSSTSSIYKNLYTQASRLNTNNNSDMKLKMTFDMDKIYTVKTRRKIVSFESADRTDAYDFLFSADVATPSLEVPEIVNLFGSSASLINNGNTSKNSVLVNNFNCNGNVLLKNASAASFGEQVPLSSIFSKRSRFLGSKNVPSVSGDEA